MKKIIVLTTIVSLLFSHKVVQDIDIKRFMGKWYVISLVPNFIETGCTNSSDTYILNKDGTVGITYNATKDGKERMIQQRGFVDDLEPGRWDIQFLKPIYVPFYRAPFEVIVLDSSYQYMAIGYPDNSYGWVFSRETTLDNDIYEEILNSLESEFGYDKEIFQKVIHNNY